MDEATAFADPDNEVKVQTAFAKLSEGKTVIMIAHRLSSIKDADCIYVLQNGEIVEKWYTQQTNREKRNICAYVEKLFRSSRMENC